MTACEIDTCFGGSLGVDVDELSFFFFKMPCDMLPLAPGPVLTPLPDPLAIELRLVPPLAAEYVCVCVRVCMCVG